MTDTLEFDFTDARQDPPSGNASRFVDRWHFVGAGLSNVWRFGDLDLPAPTGRLLLRGPNGTGKTTALEALWPYLLDLDAAKLNAGRARTTTLKQLMAEGAEKTGRRYGYAWLTFAPPAGADEPHFVTYGVRLQYAPNSSPAVKPVPFTVPARPVKDFPLHAGNGSALELDQFTERVTALGGEMFDTTEQYVEHLAGRIWGTSARQIKETAQRLRLIRNPALLGEMTAGQAADALRESLPGVADADITATAEALAASESTREAFKQDRHAAAVLSDFARIWTGYLVDTARTRLDAARAADQQVRRLTRAHTHAEDAARAAETEAARDEQLASDLDGQVQDQDDIVRAIEQSEAYKTAGSAAELAERLAAEQATAAGAAGALTAAARSAATATGTAIIALDTAAERLNELLTEAAALGAVAPPAASLFTHQHRPRQVRTVADVTANPGSGLVIVHNAGKLDDLSRDWVTQSNAWQAAAGTASALVKAHDIVARAAAERKAATEALEAAEVGLRREQQALTAAAAAARHAATDLLNQTGHWGRQHRALTATDPTDPTAGHVWDDEDIAALTEAEPAAVLDHSRTWAAHAVAAAERLAAGHDATARTLTDRAAELAAGAAEARARADQLRTGTLLPFPRPSWAGENGDDTDAFGSVLEWRDTAEGADRDRIEAALAAAGLLAAQLDIATEAASTTAWRVTAAGPVVDTNLGQVLTVDDNHPGAAAGRAVLARIRLADTASAGQEGLTIGRDGTFSAGVLTGDAAAAAIAQAGVVPTAGYVGARTRRERALAEAAHLENQARELDMQAGTARTAAAEETNLGRAVRADGRTFPDSGPLHTAETGRAHCATRLRDAATRRDRHEVAATAATAAHQRAHTEWATSVRDAGLPADVDKLQEHVAELRRKYPALNKAVAALRQLTATTLPRVLASVPNEADLAAQLSALEQVARHAHRKAGETLALLTEVQRDSDAADALRRHQQATEKRARLGVQRDTARNDATGSRKRAVEAAAKVEPAADALAAALPAQTATRRQLTALMMWPPAHAALGVPDDLTAAGDPQAGGRRILDVAAALLDGKPTSARRTLMERSDEVRAQIAQTWSIAYSDPPAELDNIDTFVLTHADEEYDPVRAARKAEDLATEAEAALAEAEAAALQDLVIGRLPNAISTAWQELNDWKNEVNRKMRAAQASSGVGVQVRIRLREDLDAAAATVQHLSCDTSAATRTDEQKRQIGDAIQALLAAADGDTMSDRLAAAIDIRSWVDVKYLVERPDGDGHRASKVWGSRVGLSGGERRLVVLAPMLAAIAAAYDRLGGRGLRLVPLDEVPAEVDEQGREGLARYMAELDLDLLCTSYLWDGAPGAWDGIDGHDLESGSNGTVVAFPTLIRGLEPIPDDVVDMPTPVA